MESSVLSEVVLPLCIVVIMVAVGMALTVDDFRRVAREPRQIGLGLVAQLVVLPLLGFAVAAAFPLTPVLAVSVVLLAASPGGTTSNLIVHATDGDRALSVSLTALSNAVVWLTMPFLVGLAFRVFGDGSQGVDFPVGEVMVQIAALTVVPVVVGMLVHHRAPAFAARVADGSKVFAAVFLAAVVVALAVENLDLVLSEGPRFAPAFIALNAAALAAGWGIARLGGLEPRQVSTIAIETGLQNSTVAITVALTVLGDGELAIIPALYGVWMLATGFGYAWLARRRDVARRPIPR